MARKSEPADRLPPPPASEEQVVAYLQTNPDFLVRHPDLVTRLAPPSRFGGGSVVDFQHYMIERLHDELDRMRGCAEHLISTSRSNMSTQNRTHEAALAILDAGDMAGLARVVADDLPTLLDVDLCTIGFETDAGNPAILPGILSLPVDFLDAVMGVGEVMLRAAAAGDPIIFGDGAGLVNSFALVRLDPAGGPPGLLALGSRAERTFHSSQGTDLLSFLAHIIDDCVQRWWPAA
jgi:hypothetical protein